MFWDLACLEVPLIDVALQCMWGLAAADIAAYLRLRLFGLHVLIMIKMATTLDIFEMLMCRAGAGKA